MYNEIVLEHFQNPRNVGRIDNANGISVVGSESCGDTMKVFFVGGRRYYYRYKI